MVSYLQSAQRIFIHRIVAEAALGKPLPKGADVHHVNEDRRDNSNTNLVICQSRGYHKLLHARARIVRAGGDPNTQAICGCCRRLKLVAEFHRNTRNKAAGIQRRCIECNQIKNKGRNRNTPKAAEKLGVVIYV